MFSFAKSVIDTVFGRKRTLDDSDSVRVVKKQRVEVTTTTTTTTADNANYMYRLRVNNLPDREVNTSKKFFKGLGYNRFKKAPDWNYGFITFDSEEGAKKAQEELEGKTLKGKALTTEYIKVLQSEFRDRFQDKKNKGKKAKMEQEDENDTRTPAEKLADQITPLWRVDYDTQLLKKNRNGKKQLMTLKRKLQGLKQINNEEQIAWAKTKNPMPCDVLEPIPSPVVDGYRTKCEFTIGTNLDGKPTVGFLLGSFRDGVVTVLDPSESLNVPSIAKEIAKDMDEYVNASELPVYHRVEKTGCWRGIMTKTQSTGDVLILIQIRGADLSPERIEEEKKSLIQFWTEKSKVNVTTLLFQVWNGDSNGITDKAPIETLTGDGYIYENILGCRFRLSASSFFQVNTPAAEILYAKCAEWCNIDKNKKTTLLDLCCGTGTIGITMAKSVDRVVGIEMVPEAIVDAKANAELNGIKNVEYYASKVEDKIDVVTGQVNEEVVAVLDPPRNGVHASVIRAVRDAQHIDRVIYISCDAKQAIDNFISLCRPQSNRFKGMPFKPSRAVVVDLFPHTEHQELMIEFVRIKEQPAEENENDEESSEQVKEGSA